MHFCPGTKRSELLTEHYYLRNSSWDKPITLYYPLAAIFSMACYFHTQEELQNSLQVNSPKVNFITLSPFGQSGEKTPKLLILAKVYLKWEFLKFHWSGHDSPGGQRAYLLGAPLRRDISTSSLNICIFCHRKQKTLPIFIAAHYIWASRASAANIPVHSLPWLQRIPLDHRAVWDVCVTVWKFH